MTPQQKDQAIALITLRHASCREALKIMLVQGNIAAALDCQREMEQCEKLVEWVQEQT